VIQRTRLFFRAALLKIAGNIELYLTSKYCEDTVITW